MTDIYSDAEWVDQIGVMMQCGVCLREYENYTPADILELSGPLCGECTEVIGAMLKDPMDRFSGYFGRLEQQWRRTLKAIGATAPEAHETS